MEIEFAAVAVQQHQGMVVCSASQNEDGDWAGSIDCRCLTECQLLKSGYLFDTDTEAIEWANTVKKDLSTMELPKYLTEEKE